MHFSERILIDRRRNILITFQRSYEKVLQLWRSCVQPVCGPITTGQPQAAASVSGRMRV